MADTTETTALVIDASGVVSGAAQVERAAQRLEAANSNIERASQRVADSTRAQERYLDSLTRRYDPAAAAAAKYAQAEARLQGIIAAGGANAVRAGEVLQMMQTRHTELAAAAEKGAVAGSRFGGALQQVGYQATDVVTQISMGGDAITALGVQLGQLLGAFGAWGAVAGLAAVSAGALYHAFSDNAEAAAQAEEAAKTYAASLTELTEVEKAYTAALRDRQGLSPIDTSTDTLEKRIRDAEGALRGLSDRSLSGDRSLWGRTKDWAFGDSDAQRRAAAEAELADARRNLSAANDLAEARDKEKLTKTLDDLHKARAEDLAVVRMSADASKEASAALEAERSVREKLKDSGAGKDQIEAEVAAARAAAVEKVQTDAANQASEAEKSRADQAAKEAARKAAQAEKEVADLERQAQAEQRLAAASGQRWAVQRQAQLDNARAEAEAKYGVGPLADRATAAAGAKIDASQARVQADYLAGLDQQLADLQSKGTARAFGDTLSDNMARARQEADRLGLSVDQILPRLEAVTRAQQTEKLRTFASSLDPAAAYDEQIAKLEALRSRLEEFGVSNDNFARAYTEAETRKLEASRAWADGAEAALRRYADAASNYGQGAGSVITSGLRRAETALNAFEQANQSVWERVRSFLLGVLSDIQAQLIKSSITGPLASALGSANWSDLFGGSSGRVDLGTGWSTDPSIGYVPNAAGGVYSSPSLSAYSNSIVSSPTLFAFAHGAGLMGEEGEEGIFPLRRLASGDLGVQGVVPEGAGNDNQAAASTNHIYIDARGADREGLAALQRQIAALNATIETRAVGAVMTAARRGGKQAAAIRGGR
ncbi:MAG: hypothetical protein RLZZ501_1434 [Pseudomonadota bacterium]|jgi:lambda family phage tail tape measure protein